MQKRKGKYGLESGVFLSLNVKIPLRLHRELSLKAVREGTTKTALIQAAIKESLERKKKKPAA